MKTFKEFESEINIVFNEAMNHEALVEKLQFLLKDGNPYASLNLGFLYENGNGVEQNYTEALAHYVLADQMGLPEAKYQMGVTCEFGRCGVAQSYEIAAKIYAEAAGLGHSDAQCQLGGLYERGYGVEQSSEKAAHYYKLASESGNARATFLLADAFTKGIGVVQSTTEALNLYHQAAELGHGFSQLILATKYKYGDELPCDYVKAYTYADLASKSALNDTDKTAAIGLRDEIFSKMNDDEKKVIFS